MTAAGLTPSGAPKADLAGIPEGRWHSANCPDKVRLERKNTPWNIPREQLRSAQQHRSRVAAPRRLTVGWRPKFSKREPAE